MAAMLENRLLARLLATARTVTALEAISAVREAGAESGHLLRARVGAQFADGTFRVLVDGKPMRLALPAGTRPGDTITLRAGTGNPAAGVLDAPSGAAGNLSATGRLIAHLLGSAPQAVPPPSRPVLERPPSAAADLPQALARAVADSGLFYESHQARWVEGGYPLEQLRQEPQARLARGRAGAASEADPQSSAKAPAHADVVDELRQSSEAPREGALSRASVAQPSSPQFGAALPEQALPAEQAALVRQQLEILAGRQVAWAGELWPGQPARWEIETEQREAPDESGPRQWTTTLALEMPALGAIGARLTFDTTGVRIGLSVQDEQSLRRVRAALPQLAAALADAGMTNARIEATQHAPEH